MVVSLQPFLLFVALSLPLGPASGDLRFRVIIAMGISKISRNKRFFALLRMTVCDNCGAVVQAERNC